VLTDGCNADCSEVLTAAVEWLVHERGYRPEEIVLDTLASGMATPTTRVVPLSVLRRVAAVTGTNQDDHASVVDCPDPEQPRWRFPCKLRRGRILVDLLPPRLLEQEAHVGMRVGGENAPAWGDHYYELIFRKSAGNGWRLAEAKLAGMS
jgi:hypothetical protein